MVVKVILVFLYSISCFGSWRFMVKNTRNVITPWRGRVSLSPTIVQGQGCDLWDAQGKKYKDVSAGLAVSSIGQNHPAIVTALKDFLSSGFPSYLNPSCNILKREEITQRLLSKSNMPDGGAFWCNTGSEANNLLRKAALNYYSGRGQLQKTKIATTAESFHGSIGEARFMTRDGRTDEDQRLIQSSDFVSLPSPVRGREDETLSQIKRILSEHHEQIAALLIPGHGGSGEAAGRDWPEINSFYQKLSQLCKEYDILLFWDCVMSGGGRVGGDSSGKGYFASDHYDNIKVDGRSFAKGLTAGYGSAGMMMVSRELAEAIDQNCDFGSTYSGQYSTIVAASAVLDEIEKDQHSILCNAKYMGDLWSQEFVPQLLENFPEIVLAANGTGLLQALVLHKKTDLKVLTEALLKEGLLVFAMRRKLDDSVVLMITPPLIIEEEEMHTIFLGIYKALLSL